MARDPHDFDSALDSSGKGWIGTKGMTKVENIGKVNKKKDRKDIDSRVQADNPERSVGKRATRFAQDQTEAMGNEIGAKKSVGKQKSSDSNLKGFGMKSKGKASAKRVADADPMKDNMLRTRGKGRTSK